MVQRSLFDQFLTMYLQVAGSLAFGHPLAVADSGDEPPDVDFGPVDTVVLVDSAAELVAEVNASNGCLVASIACDDEQLAQQFADQVHAFKIGINKPPPGEQLYGNFPDYQRYPTV